ncbi:MAG: hypothetical protein AB8B74_00295 [Crocinitomicaceae bacterium]
MRTLLSTCIKQNVLVQVKVLGQIANLPIENPIALKPGEGIVGHVF